jgi:hypothetical protein
MPPAEVTNLTGVAGNGELTLNWTDPADADFDHIEITWIGGAGGSVEVVKAAQRETITGLVNNTAYTFTVKTVDDSGNKNKSPGQTIDLTPTGDALVWTPFSFDAPDDARTLYSVVWDGSRYVGMAFENTETPNTKAAYSNDGETWTFSDSPVAAGDGNYTFGTMGNAHIWTGTKHVAGGGEGKIAYSTDGETWTVLTGTQTGMGASGAINGIAWNGSDKFVAVGANGRIAYSANGETWTVVTTSNNPFGSTAINSVAWGGPAGQEKFVAVGNSNANAVAYSTNGVSWTKTTSPFGTSYYARSIAWGGSPGNEKFVAAGQSGRVWYSSDGITWSAPLPGVLGYQTGSTTTVNNISAIAYGGGKFVVTGADGKAAYSLDDGLTWTLIPGDVLGSGFITINHLYYAHGRFFASGAASNAIGIRMAYSNAQE